ncbi:MAG: hypothetical protein M1536_08525, partial [Firmicutes bacterium]|nr:hypothetical protein [Bacillota bacterium]
MSFWEEVRAKVLEHTTSSDLTAGLYKKIASTGSNEMAMVKPTYYLGQISVLTMDYMDFVKT